MHAVPFATARIWAGDVGDCSGRRPRAGCRSPRTGESRMDLAARNAAIVRNLAPAIAEANPDGILLVATNPSTCCIFVEPVGPAAGARVRVGDDPRHGPLPDAPGRPLRSGSAIGPRVHRGRARRLRGPVSVVREHRRDAPPRVRPTHRHRPRPGRAGRSSPTPVRRVPDHRAQGRPYAVAAGLVRYRPGDPAPMARCCPWLADPRLSRHLGRVLHCRGGGGAADRADPAAPDGRRRGRRAATVGGVPAARRSTRSAPGPSAPDPVGRRRSVADRVGQMRPCRHPIHAPPPSSPSTAVCPTAAGPSLATATTRTPRYVRAAISPIRACSMPPVSRDPGRLAADRPGPDRAHRGRARQRHRDRRLARGLLAGDAPPPKRAGRRPVIRPSRAATRVGCRPPRRRRRSGSTGGDRRPASWSRTWTPSSDSPPSP